MKLCWPCILVAFVVTTLLILFGMIMGADLIKNAKAGTFRGENREPCTWAISYYALGERVDAKSKHAWHLTKDEQAQLFGPFVAGALFVVPGAASFTCAGKTTTILTAPLPQGSLTELKD